MRSWRIIAPVVLVVVGLAAVAPLLLLRGTDGTGRVDSARDAASTPSRSSSPASAPDQAGFPIETSSSTYFGRPFETVRIDGRYPGARGRTSLRVELREADGWTRFPLPAVTQPSGDFQAYVELGGPGIYRLRVVDPDQGATSSVLELVVF